MRCLRSRDSRRAPSWPGHPAFTLTVMGNNFTLDSVVLFGGTALPTTWEDNNQLTATVTTAQVMNAGAVPITVATSSAPDALVSAPVSFTVQPLPALASNSIDPSIATVGGPAFVLTVLGQGFVPSAVVQWNGTALQTTYVSELQLQAQVPASDIASIGTAAVTVQNSTGRWNNRTIDTQDRRRRTRRRVLADHARSCRRNQLQVTFIPHREHLERECGWYPFLRPHCGRESDRDGCRQQQHYATRCSRSDDGSDSLGSHRTYRLCQYDLRRREGIRLSAPVGGAGTIQSYDIESGNARLDRHLSVGGIIAARSDGAQWIDLHER